VFSEKDMEDAIAINPARFLKKEGLKLLSQQHSIGNFRFDLLFGDRFGRKFIAEIQKGALDRNHSFKIVEYYNKYQNEHPGEKVEVIVVANTISSERMQFFDKFGISYIEIPDEDIIRWKSENPSIEPVQYCFYSMNTTCYKHEKSNLPPKSGVSGRSEAKSSMI